jgi:hypothetical protein
MPRKRAAKPVTTVAPHRSPQLVELLEAARRCDDVASVRRFLAAGGSPDALVELKYTGAVSVPAPIFFKAITKSCFCRLALTRMLSAMMRLAAR